MEDPILYRERDKIGIMTVNRSHARNALSWEAQTKFSELINNIESNPPRALIITGAGDKAFISGGDLNQLAADPTPANGERLRATMTNALHKMERLSCPVIGVVNGHVAGGGLEVLSACDLRMAAESAKFHFVHIRMGLTPGWGGMRRLFNLIGASHLTEMMLTGKSIAAQEALAIGLIHKVVPSEESNGHTVLDYALEWANKIKELPKIPLAATKQLIHTMSDAASIDALNRAESETFLSLFGKADNLEALRAFKEKRKPNFNA